MDQDVVTLGELRRAVDSLAHQLSTVRAEMGTVASIPSQLDSLAQLWAAQLETERQRTGRELEKVVGRLDNLEEDVKDLDSWKTWAFRLVLGVVAMALLALVVNGDPTGPT